MQVISVVGQKGGAGKSTVALHIAGCAEAAGISTAIIDTDPQGSAHKWAERREADTPAVVLQPDGNMLRVLAGRAEANGVGLLIIDTPGKAAETALAACEIADLILVPLRPTQFDLETLGTVKRTARIAEKLDHAWVILSQCPTNSSRPLEAGEAGVAGYGMRLAPVRIHQRADFAYAMSEGRTATETEPLGKAAREADALFAWIQTILPLKIKKAA